ncbi:cyclin-dependent kinase, putative [Eimeria maxima]|uniref:Cyclin-dependent kinases regulatory subunit n=1 Tax=Eimeria maxima TaxID=5804 RepID=U6M589_EIMMA|nr:cyclin-dependent kinase, putative [Eimeria maxima]CDJ59186.1 cyclin-dependent kinase, putative [Eimeria maxima]
MAVASAAEASAAGKAILPAALAAEATICDGKPTPACSGGEKTAAAVAAEASRAAFLREELLNLAESRYTAVFVPVDQHLLEQMNDEFIRSDISRYPVKNTPSGIVFYSPRYSDDRFIYRHVLLSAGVKRAAEEIANATKSAFLTEGQFIYQLGIHLSPGWEHFMIFKGEMRELILRRPQQQQDSPHSQNHAHIDEISDESDDSEAEESATPATATESRSPPPRHQDLGSLLHEIADTAAIHQIRQQNLVQQRMAIAKAVEKANRLLLLIVQLQRPPQHVPPKVFDRMRCLLASYFFSSLSHFCSGEEQQQRSTGRKFFLQNGSIGKQGQLLLLLLQSVAAARQHYPASDAMELLFLQHKLLLQHQGLMQQKVSRISLRRMDKRQQICAASCAIEAPQELHEKRLEQREDKQQNRQCQETSPLPVATPHMDSSPMQQHGKRQPACCNATAVADDSAGCPDDASAALESAVPPRRMAAKERATSLPAVAAGGIGSPTSQGKEKRRRCPLKQEKLCR